MDTEAISNKHVNSLIDLNSKEDITPTLHKPLIEDTNGSVSDVEIRTLLIDSDSDEDITSIIMEKSLIQSTDDLDYSGVDNIIKIKTGDFHFRKKMKAVIDSDSDSGNDIHPLIDETLNRNTNDLVSDVKMYKSPMKNRLAIVETDSDKNFNKKTYLELNGHYKKKFTKKRKKAKVLVDSSDDDNTTKELKLDQIDKKNCVYDSDTSEDAVAPGIIPKNLPKRESAKEAMVQMQIIQSESQRMAREANIRVPYHRPKQYSLKEFLSRRTDDKNIAPIVQKKTAANIKMNPTELFEYAKKMKQRELEATRFFKNDNEDEEDVETLSNEEIVQKNINHNVSDDNDLGEGNQINNFQSTTVVEKLHGVMEIKDKEIDTAMTVSINEDYFDGLVAIGRNRLINKHKPRLTGEDIIDLETDCTTSPIISGPKELFNRFIKQQNPRTVVKLDVIKTENGILELSNADIVESFARDPIPGAAYSKLKNELMNKIALKRNEEFLKKNRTILEVTARDEAEYTDCETDYEDSKTLDKIMDAHANSLSAEENDDELEKEENSNDENNSSHNEEENVADEEDEDIEDCDKEDDDDEEEMVVKKSRILAPSVDSEVDELAGAKMEDTLSIISQTQTVGESDELMGLCSGNFDSTQIKINNSDKLFETSLSQPNDFELMDLCSGVFKTQFAVINKSEELNHENNEEISIFEKIRNTFDSSSDSENDNISKPHRNKNNQKKKLGFSDDEYEDSDADGDKNSSIAATEEQIMNYDSEENEIILQENKERQKEANAFFEKEAELSESEWGSADEDERDLDKFDVELGDEDEFDQGDLQNQLERIHMRQVLDQDAREVKLIQEMFMEDEERDGIGRDRKFRWMNVDNSFILEDQNKLNPNVLEEHNSDDENEELWRKMRFERDSFLKEDIDKNVNLEPTNENTRTVADGSNNIFTSKKKIKILNSKNNIQSLSLPSSPFLLTKDVVSRESFLSRDETTISRLASLNKHINDPDAIQLESGKTKSFVFTAINPTVIEDKIQLKRKSTDIIHNAETKKVKRNENFNSKRLLDHLA